MLIYNDTKILRLSDMKYPMYLVNLRLDYPNTQFPYPLPSENLSVFGYAEVHESDKPTFDENVSYLAEDFPELKEDGIYYKTYVVKDYTPEEISDRLQAAKDVLINDSVYIYQADLEQSFTYPEGEGGKPFKINGSSFVIWTNINYLLSKDETLNVKIKFEDNSIVEMDKTAFDTFYQFVNEKYNQVRDNYYSFILSVQAVTVITDLPEMPTTFMEM